jgi:hypothetical protein
LTIARICFARPSAISSSPRGSDIASSGKIPPQKEPTSMAFIWSAIGRSRMMVTCLSSAAWRKTAFMIWSQTSE